MSERELALADIRRAIYLHEYNPEALMAQIVALAAPPVGVSPQPDFIDIVLDGPPASESGRFVEVENEHGESIRMGTWIPRPDGYWALRLPASLAPVEPTPPTEDEDDDEVPVARPEGAPDAWSAPLRKPVVPKILSTDDFYALLRILEVLPADPFLSALQSKLSDEERRQHGNQASHLSGPEFVREIERVEALIQSRVQLPALPVEPTPPQPCIPDEKYPEACVLATSTHGTRDGVIRCDFCGCPVAPFDDDDLSPVEPTPDAQVCVWREIETAPKDGTEVLLLGPDGSIDFGRWRADRKYAAGGVWRMRQWLYVFPDAVAWSPIPPRWAPAPQGGEQ